MTNAKVQKFLPNNFLQVLGNNLPAIYTAFNEGAGNTEVLIQSIIDQLFLTTASGKYLINLGEEGGFIMPSNSGLDIRSYRVLVPIMVSAPKQVRISIEDLISAFYQNIRTKPSILSNVAGPYSLIDGDDLIVETESGTATVSIVASQVSDISNVSAEEIAAILNISQKIFAAEAVKDRTTGLSSVRLTSSATGTSAFIRVLGGKLQNVLQLPNIADTLASAATTWNLTKDSVYTDELKFQWDGIGTNPNIYKVTTGDFVTIRGLTDGLDPFSELNGSFEVIDVGYDYFVVRNDLFDVISSSFTQNADNNIIFTKSDKTTLFDAAEYAILSETNRQTITVTVPAVPPLARRSLKGSAHIHGYVTDIIDFTRSTLKVSLGVGQTKPDGDNWFVLRSANSRVDFTKKYYRSVSVDASTTEPTYVLDNSNTEYSTLPYTVATTLSASESIYAEIDSNEYILSFSDYRHGLQNSWGFTLGGFIGSSNIVAGDLNKEHQVKKVVNENTIIFGLSDASGNDLTFDGISFGVSDVYRYATNQSDGSDFYLDFGTEAARITSGLAVGQTFKFDPASGIDVQPLLANQLKYRKLVVKSVSGALVKFSSGLGIGPEGSIITSVTGSRSGYIGGTAGTYFLDKTSPVNQDRVFNFLQSVFVGYTAPQNPLYLGPYLYDPEGIQTSVTVAGQIVSSSEKIFKGESRAAIQVDETNLVGTFPQTGEIVISYGNGDYEGPIRYSAYVKNTSSTQILIDPAYRFRFSHDVGAKIQYIHERIAYKPTIDGADYPFYLTGTSEARDALFRMIELLVAVGIFVETDVLFPDLRYADSSISPFE